MVIKVEGWTIDEFCAYCRQSSIIVPNFTGPDANKCLELIKLSISLHAQAGVYIMYFDLYLQDLFFSPGERRCSGRGEHLQTL